MAEWMPTTDQVRRAAYWAGKMPITPVEFDRWLAAHDLVVRLEMLWDVAHDLSGYDWAGYEFRAEDALNDRADRIEANS